MGRIEQGITPQDRSAVICKRFKFAAAHYLPDYNGLCKNVHGHTYYVDVYATGCIYADGMVKDFADIGTMFNIEIEELFDHTLLNETLPEQYHPPTTEHVAHYILDALRLHSDAIFKVRLWEGDSQFAEVDAYA